MGGEYTMKSKLVVFFAALAILAYASFMSPPKEDEDGRSLRREILVDIPNPLNVRLVNSTNVPYEFSIFQSTNATMLPMPNMRIEVKNRITGQVKSYVPVILGEKRKTFRLQAGKMVELAIYHRGLKLTPGDYEIVVLFYRDDDIEQKIPVAASKPLLVSIPSKSEKTSEVENYPNPLIYTNFSLIVAQVPILGITQSGKAKWQEGKTAKRLNKNCRLALLPLSHFSPLP
jgi:hypothetical protein